MRKFLMVVAVGALALLVVAPSMALEFKYGQETRVRFYDYSNLGFANDPKSSNPRGVQLRIRPRFDASDDNGNISALWRAEFGDTEFGGGGGANSTAFGINRNAGNPSYSIAPLNNRVGNGAGGSAGADGVALETKWAYLDFALPFGVPLRVRAGIQPWYLPKSMMADDDFAGVRAYGSIAPVSYDLFWIRAARGASTTTVPSGAAGQPGFNKTIDNSLDYYQAKVDVALMKAFNPGVYYVFGDNRANCTGVEAVSNGTANTATAGFVNTCATGISRIRNQHYVGVTVTGDLNFMTYDLDWIWGQAKGGPTGGFLNTNGEPIKVQGWILDGGIHIPVGPVRFNLVGQYATGDKDANQPTKTKSDAWPGGPAPSWSGPSQVAGGTYELIGEGGSFDVVSIQTAPTNLWTLGASVEYNPVKALTLRVHYLYAGFANKNGNCMRDTSGTLDGTCFGPQYQVLAGKKNLGQEIGLRADYQMWTGFKLQGFTGWLVPSTGSTTGKYILQMLYSF